MRRNTIRTSVMLAGILLLPLLIVVAQETTSLLIEGPHSDSGKTLCRSGRSSADHGRIAALRRESHHFDITRERYASAGNGVGVAASGRPF